MMDSIWCENVQMPSFPQLDGNLQTDVLIIGGGLTGLLCAWKLTRAGMDCVLIEQNRIMSSVSGRTTAKLTAQHGIIYDKLIQKYGLEKARQYWQVNRDAVQELGELAVALTVIFKNRIAICMQQAVRKNWKQK